MIIHYRIRLAPYHTCEYASTNTPPPPNGSDRYTRDQIQIVNSELALLYTPHPPLWFLSSSCSTAYGFAEESSLSPAKDGSYGSHAVGFAPVLVVNGKLLMTDKPIAVRDLSSYLLLIWLFTVSNS